MSRKGNLRSFMNRLVINTATDELFIALKKGDEVFSIKINSKMHHNETMLSQIDGLLVAHELTIQDIDEFGVVIGPGSFTGIRVGIATIKAFRDALGAKAKGINNLKYLFELAKMKSNDVQIVAILGSKDSYFVARLVNEEVYVYERNLTLNELKAIAGNRSIGMFCADENLNCFEVEQNAEILFECLVQSKDEQLIPVYYQLSQAENEKLKRSELIIEKASIVDCEEIYALENNNILVNTMTKSQIEIALNDDNYAFFKACVENEIVGFVMLQKSDEFNIDSIAVKKGFRNYGIATRLISTAEEYCREQGLSVLSLEVSVKNITAFLLYEKLGFKQRRIRKNYYADGADCIEMIKEV